MSFQKDDNFKRYYSIGEVAKMFDLSKSVIRFWENEFDLLRPHKNSKGDRRFTQQNIEQIRIIYNLVRERGFTLEGAKKEIRQKRKYLKEREAWILRMKEIKAFLEALKKEL